MPDAKIIELLQRIHRVDDEIIHLLAQRIEFSQEFYAREAETGEFHHEQERIVKDRIGKLTKEAQLDEELVTKLYTHIIKHARKHRKRIHKETKKRLKREAKIQ